MIQLVPKTLFDCYNTVFGNVWAVLNIFDEYFEFLGQICEGNGGFWEAKLNKNDVFWNCGRIFADFLIRKWFIGIAFMKTDVLR